MTDPAPTSPSVIRRLEERTLNAWPALREVHYDGWLLRFADGFTHRSNSVQPLFAGSLDVEEKIARCERLYAEAGLPCTFKLTAASEPAHLDALLTARGYEIETPTSVRTVPLAEVLDALPGAQVGVSVEAQLTEEWLRAYFACSGREADGLPIARRIFQSIAVPVRYASVLRDGHIVAVGCGVLDDGYLGLFDLATRPEHRRQGLATAIMAALLEWGRASRAATAYLLVVADNAPALRLYERCGFREGYQYWYRVRR